MLQRSAGRQVGGVMVAPWGVGVGVGVALSMGVEGWVVEGLVQMSWGVGAIVV